MSRLYDSLGFRDLLHPANNIVEFRLWDLRVRHDGNQHGLARLSVRLRQLSHGSEQVVTRHEFYTRACLYCC